MLARLAARTRYIHMRQAVCLCAPSQPGAGSVTSFLVRGRCSSSSGPQNGSIATEGTEAHATQLEIFPTSREATAAKTVIGVLTVQRARASTIAQKGANARTCPRARARHARKWARRVVVLPPRGCNAREPSVHLTRAASSLSARVRPSALVWPPLLSLSLCTKESPPFPVAVARCGVDAIVANRQTERE